jgi:hypothetical protein
MGEGVITSQTAELIDVNEVRATCGIARHCCPPKAADDLRRNQIGNSRPESSAGQLENHDPALV